MRERVRSQDDFLVLPENWETLQAFLRVQTCWVRAGVMGTPTGLDYCRIEAAWRMAGIRVTPELFDEIQSMELAALPIMTNADG